MVLGLAVGLACAMLVATPSLAQAQEAPRLQSTDISGTAVSKAGRPLAGLPICIEADTQSGCPTETDARGRYRLRLTQSYAQECISTCWDTTVPEWPRVTIGRHWQDSKWQPQSLGTDWGRDVRTELKRRKTVRGHVLGKRGKPVKGVQICADGNWSADDQKLGRPQPDMICRDTRNGGRYRIPVAASGELYVWDKRFMPRDRDPYESAGFVGEFDPGQRHDVQVLSLVRAKPVTVSGSTGAPGYSVCLRWEEPRRGFKCSTSDDDADYRIRARRWVLADRQGAKLNHSLGLDLPWWPESGTRSSDGDDLLNPSREEETLRLRPGRSASRDWGALTLRGEGTMALCLSASSQTPPGAVGADTRPWVDYCDIFNGWPSVPAMEETYFFSDPHDFKVAFERGMTAQWVGSDGTWANARTIRVEPSTHTTVVRPG